MAYYKRYGAAGNKELAKSSFKFPLEDDGYKGRITFEAIQEAYLSLAETAFAGLVEGAAAVDAARGSPRGDVRFPDKKKQNEEALRALMGENKTIRGKVPPRIGAGRKASLYLPQALQFQDTVEYTGIDLGIIGSAAEQVLLAGGTGGKVAQAAARNILPDFASIQEAFSKGLRSEGAQIAALRLTSKISPEIQGAIETQTGIAINPNRRSTLRGIGIRQFRFSFKMIPTSPEEAEEVKRIVQFFREEMYPDTSDDTTTAALRFPSKFNIKLFYDKKKVATRILPCFLQGVDVVYNATGMAFHKDGNFQETDISLNFVEERPLTKRDIIEEADALGDGYTFGTGF
jgi:hypothetical protein|tara:strand:+ start:4475 stop:5509 length:1035 start_codon:yes stop_codon:yes gene_type:complete